MALSAIAQTPPLPATDVTNAEIQAFINSLPKDAVSDKPIRIVDVGGYHVGVYGVAIPICNIHCKITSTNHGERRS